MCSDFDPQDDWQAEPNHYVDRGCLLTLLIFAIIVIIFLVMLLLDS